MDYLRDKGRKDNRYVSTQVKTVLKGINVQIEGDTHNDWMCLCPFHGNRNTPSMTVGKTNGKFYCFNEACGESGDLEMMVMKLTGRNLMEAMRYIAKKSSESFGDIDDLIADLTEVEPEYKEFPQKTLDRLHDALRTAPSAVEYLKGRGFTIDTIKYFQMGYSAVQNMVTVPVHSPNGLPVGLVGRSVVGKEFKNSPKLPRNTTLFNIHRAKRVGSIAVVNESTFDSARIHQAGYPNAVGSLGGNLSARNISLLDRYFDTIILMTDFDNKDDHISKNCRKCPGVCRGHNPGRDMGYKLIGSLPHKDILWATYENGMVYPHGAKDAGEMTDDEIAQCIENATMPVVYDTWDLY